MPTERRSRADARPIGIRAAVLVHFARRMGRPLLWVLLYTIVGAVVLKWDVTRSGEEVDFGRAIYAMYTQLFFEPTFELPVGTVSRVLMFATPVVGVFLIFDGLVKVGAELLDRDARRDAWMRIMSERMQDHIVVCGLGHVGFRVVEELRALGEPIVGIEKNTAESFVEVVRGYEIPVFVGDARRDELLVSAGVARARAIVCATDDDLVNLEVSLDAKRMNPAIRVVMRMFDQRLASKVGGALDLDQTFSTSSLSAPLIALQATEPGIRAAYRLGDGTMRVVFERQLGQGFKPRKLEAFERAIGARVVDHRAPEARRESEDLWPGDLIVVDTTARDLTTVLAKIDR